MVKTLRYQVKNKLMKSNNIMQIQMQICTALIVGLLHELFITNLKQLLSCKFIGNALLRCMSWATVAIRDFYELRNIGHLIKDGFVHSTQPLMKTIRVFNVDPDHSVYCIMTGIRLFILCCVDRKNAVFFSKSIWRKKTTDCTTLFPTCIANKKILNTRQQLGTFPLQ